MENTTSPVPSSWTVSQRTVIIVVVCIVVAIILGCSIGIPLQQKADDDAKIKAEKESKVTTPIDTEAKAASDTAAKVTADAIAKATADAIAKATADAAEKATADAEAKAAADTAANADSPTIIKLKALADNSSGDKRAQYNMMIVVQRSIEAKEKSGEPLTLGEAILGNSISRL